jgi:hypothetical protein
MRLDTKTVNVLKNFSTINPSMLFYEGNILKTISPNKTVMAKANIETTIGKKFAIYNLGKLLSTLSFYDNPEIVLNEQNLIISNGNGSSTTLAYADEATIKTPPNRDITLPSIDAEFKISSNALNNILKMLGTLGLPEIAISGDGVNLFVSALDSKNTNSEHHTEKVGSTDKTFRAIFKAENIKLIPGDYDVSVSSRGISHFRGAEAEYWIAVEQNSTF